MILIDPTYDLLRSLKKYPVVLTNGNFDILHRGHVRLLRLCAALGNVFVAVDTDDRVREQKGKGRPVNPLQWRMEVVDGISGVAYVFPFCRAISEIAAMLRPDFLVKGAEWAGKVEGAEYAKYTILVEHDDTSSTEIIDQLKKDNPCRS